MTVEVGEMVAIVGPSGSGKSTLMHILGLLHSPDRGYDPPPSLVLDGTDVTELRDRERTRMRAERIGFVFQSFNLVPTLTAVETWRFRPSTLASGERRRWLLPQRPWLRWEWGTGWATVPRNCRVGSSSEWPSRVPWSQSQRSYWQTSLQETWTRRTPANCLNCYTSSTRERRQTMVLVTHDPE